MTKVKNNAAEIVLTVITIAIIMSSCGNHYTCPSYACNDEQSRPNLVFVNH